MRRSKPCLCAWALFMAAWFAGGLTAAGAVPVPATALVRPVPASSVRNQYNKIKFQVGSDSAKRHLELANSLEDRKIYIYAVEQFQLAADRAEGPAKRLATKALMAMQGLNPSFRERYYHDPTRSERLNYRGKAAAEHRRDRKGWKRMADFAANHPEELLKEALDGYRKLVHDANDILKIDKKGRILLKEGPISASVSTVLRESEGMIRINSETCIRNGFLKQLQAVEQVGMVASDRLRVLTQGSTVVAGELHDLGEALYKQLKTDFKDAPLRPIDLFVFNDMGSFRSCCLRAGRGRYQGVCSFTDQENYTAVICVEHLGGGEDAAYGLALRELTKAFHYGITGRVLPDWYLEGLAETYGGMGAFEWKRGRLKTKGRLASDRLAPLLKSNGRLTIRDLMFKDRITSDKDRTLLFFAQSWAFLHYLQNGAGKGTARKLKRWEEECCSRMLDKDAVVDRLQSAFLNDLPKLETGFEKYLASLAR